MKKISNSLKIQIGSKNSDKHRKKEVKASLNAIQKLSQQIDQQIIMSKYNRKQKHEAKTEVEVENEQDHEEEDSIYWPGEAKNRGRNTIYNIIKQSIELYVAPCMQDEANSSEKDHRQGKFIDIQFYEQYKKTKQFNSDFKLIVSELQALRRLLLGRSEPASLINESDILLLIQRLLKTKARTSNNSQDYSLHAIEKLQEIQQSLQRRLQQMKDKMQHKQKIVDQLKANQTSILDDIELLSNRNLKLSRQLNSINSNHKFNEISSQQEPEPYNQAPVPAQQAKNHNKAVNKNQTNDYESEYLELMKFYQLYNPETHQIEQSFPKNKTEAMMLLNKIQTKIQQIQMKKALISFSV